MATKIPAKLGGDLVEEMLAPAATKSFSLPTCPADPLSTANAGSTFEPKTPQTTLGKSDFQLQQLNDSSTQSQPMHCHCHCNGNQLQPMATNDSCTQVQPMATNGNQYDSSTQVHPLNPTVHFLYRSTRQPFNVEAQTQCPML